MSGPDDEMPSQRLKTDTSTARSPDPGRTWPSDDDVPAVLLFVVLGAFGLLIPAQNDTFWLLRSGREMWATKAFLTSEAFSHTSFGAPLHNHWWLTQAMFYGTYVLGGPVLLAAFAGALAFLAVWGSYRLLRGGFEIRLMLLAFLALATVPEWAIRAQVVSLAFLVLMAHLVERDRIAWLPAVCVVWANAHAMVIFGVAIAVACALEAAMWTRRFVVRDAFVAVACVVAPVLSPVGLEYWPRVLATVSTSRELELQEYRMPFEVAAIPFWVALATLVVLGIRRRRQLAQHPRQDRILLLASAILGVAAVTAARNIAFFSVIAAPALSRVLVVAPPRHHRVRSAGPVGYGLIAVAMLVTLAFTAMRWQNGGSALGWQPISEGALMAVRTCPDPMFNDFEDGGYLMWELPDRKVFVDSRIEAYPATLLRRTRAAELFGDYRDLFREYKIACAIVKAGSPLDAGLRRDGVRVAYADASRTVFLTQRGSER